MRRILTIFILIALVISPVFALEKYMQDDGSITFTPNIKYDLTTGVHTWMDVDATYNTCGIAFNKSISDFYNYGWYGPNSSVWKPVGASAYSKALSVGNWIDVPSGYNMSYAMWSCSGDIAFGAIHIRPDFMPAPTPGFTGTPTGGAAPLLVSFTDNNAATNTWWKWTYGDGIIDNASTSAKIHTYTSPGTYSVRLDTYSPYYGYQNVTRTEYISVINPSDYILNHYVKNSESGVLVDGATVGLKNTTTGKWVYSTASGGYKVWSADAGGIPLGQNQTVELYAYKSGYTAVNSTITIPYDFYTHYSFMVPTSVVNATGTGTLVVTAVKNSDGSPLANVAVILDDNQLGVTNAAGAATMRNVTAGTRALQASLSGYQSIEKSFTITEGQTTMLVIDLTKVGETPIATYVSPTSTSYLVDTDGDGIGDTSSSIVGNYTAGQLNQTAASGIMAFLGLLMQLWPIIVVLILLKLLKVV